MEEEEKRNLMYRGQTWQEHLQAEGKTDEQHREGLREQATTRVKTGLLLGEVAKAESVDIEDAELKARIKELKKQYPDEQIVITSYSIHYTKLYDVLSHPDCDRRPRNSTGSVLPHRGRSRNNFV